MTQDSITILYLHGFLGSGSGQKALWYQQKFTEVGDGFFAPNYPQNNPDESIVYLNNFIQQHILSIQQPWLIIGSSMGGFVGQYLANQYQVPLIMVNPALHPMKLFKNYLGSHENSQTGEQLNVDEAFISKLMQYDCEALTKVPVLLLQDKGDEVVPYQWAYEKYLQTALVNLYENGDHAFQHLEQSWEDVYKFVRYATRNALKSL